MAALTMTLTTIPYLSSEFENGTVYVELEETENEPACLYIDIACNIW
jgi:hypothetical protein